MGKVSSRMIDVVVYLVLSACILLCLNLLCEITADLITDATNESSTHA